MSYQVIARKWRPQRFDDVVGQQAVTRTLRNAIASGRLAQAFVFAGPRGVGKTTTARILARALSCEKGPTADPCGVCDACTEIAEGRDIDVLEIDAATHTGVDNVREVIIAGLGIMPVRNRYKVFIIDEVHQLSSGSFNALLKSIEEPPPHVVFMMATTELEKIPETVLSRAQVYEFRAISAKTIADQLRRIVDAEGITVDEQSLQLIARDADGSMRDAQSKLDQVIAFTGTTIGPDDVSTVLGLVGRDLLLDAVQAVVDEDAPAAFALAARAVEMGYDLRLVCRELSRVVRDLLVLSVDPSRASDPEIAGEGERDRLIGLARRFSREDLLRAFDLLTRAESDIRGAAQPRYHLEMALLRWIYLRKMVAIEELIGGTSPSLPAAGRPSQPAVQAAPSPPARPAPPAAPRPAEAPARPAPASLQPAQTASRPAARAVPVPSPSIPAGSAGFAGFKDALLAEVRKSKGVFYNTVIVQAQRVDVAADRVTFTFSSTQRAIRDVFEKDRAWLEAQALQVTGRRIVVESLLSDQAIVAGSASESTGTGSPASGASPSDETGAAIRTRGDAASGGSELDEMASRARKIADERANDPKALAKKSALREQALADAGVQALLEVFPAEIRDVEEMEP
jgi:DNA polymerase-3 subunit gamma/tau